MTQHILRYVRITNSGKLTDRYVTAQVKEASDPEQRAFGRLFLIVELTSPWFPSAQIGQTIINTIARQYYKSTETDLLARFEGALRQVNETLDQLIRTSEDSLAERLHAVVLLQADNHLHVANTGSARAWLVRDGKGSPLLSPTKGSSQPSKIFGSVLSGTLEPGDRVIASSSGIGSILTDSELTTNILGAADFVATAIRLVNLLRAKRGQWVNALVLEYQDEVSAANQPAHPLPDTLYLDTGSVGDWRLTIAQSWARLRDGATNAGTLMGQLSRNLLYLVRTSILPTTKEFTSRTQQLTQQGLATWRAQGWPSLARATRNARAAVQSLRTKPTEPSQSPSPSRADTLIGKTVFAIHDYQGEPELLVAEPDEPKPTDRVRHYSAPPPVPPASALEQLVDRRPRLSLPSLHLTLPRLSIPNSFDARSLGFVAIVVILIGLLASNLWALQTRRSEQLSRTQAAERLTELQDKLQEAKLAKIFNQSEKAAAAAQAVIDGSAQLASSPLASDGTEIAAEAQAVLDDLTGTKRLSSLTELGQVDGSRLALWQDHITVARSTGGLVTYPTSGGESADLALPSNDELTALAPFHGKDGMVVLSSGHAVYATSQAAGPLSPLTLSSGSWKAGSAIKAFLGNLYVLAPEDNAIWKYPATGDTLAEGQSYVTDGTDVGQGVDLAIDGNVYVLTKTGEIIKLNRGKRVELRVRDIPGPGDTLTEPRQIEAMSDRLYVLDGNRIVKLGSDGRYEQQYALTGGEPIRAFAIKDSTLFALTDTRLVKAELN